jgi:hypothetical protein
MGMLGWVFAYLGPDTLLPLTSGLAAVVGALLMFGRSARRLAVRWSRALVRQAPGAPGMRRVGPDR